MALRAVDQPEFRARLGYLLYRFDVDAQDLSKEIGKHAGYISWLMTGAKRVPTEMVVPIAEAFHKLRGANVIEVGKYLIGLSPNFDDSAMGGKRGPATFLSDVSATAA